MDERTPINRGASNMYSTIMDVSYLRYFWNLLVVFEFTKLYSWYRVYCNWSWIDTLHVISIFSVFIGIRSINCIVSLRLSFYSVINSLLLGRPTLSEKGLLNIPAPKGYISVLWYTLCALYFCARMSCNKLQSVLH